MTLIVDQDQFMPIRIVHGCNLIYVQQGSHPMIVIERAHAVEFAKAIEAGTGETTKIGSTEGESATAEGGDAQALSSYGVVQTAR